MLFAIDVARGEERRRDAFDGDAVLVGEVSHALQFVDGGVEAAVGDFGIPGDVADAVSGEVFQVGIVGRCTLASQSHADGWSWRGCNWFDICGKRGCGGAGGREEFSAIHLQDMIQRVRSALFSGIVAALQEKIWPQKRHFLAARLMVSAQSGQVLVSAPGSSKEGLGSAGGCGCRAARAFTAPRLYLLMPAAFSSKFMPIGETPLCWNSSASAMNDRINSASRGVACVPASSRGSSRPEVSDKTSPA